MCMARAIVVGKCYAEKDDSDSWKQKWDHIKSSHVITGSRSHEVIGSS